MPRRVGRGAARGGARRRAPRRTPSSVCTRARRRRWKRAAHRAAALGRARAADAIRSCGRRLTGGRRGSAAASRRRPRRATSDDAEPLLEELRCCAMRGASARRRCGQLGCCRCPPRWPRRRVATAAAARRARTRLSARRGRRRRAAPAAIGRRNAGDDPRVGPLAPILSPLLAEALLWFLQRVAAGYLMPDEASTSVLCPPLLAAWGRDTAGGAAMLTACVEAAAVYLLRWRGEPALARATCSLLASLARLSAAAPLMPSLPATAASSGSPHRRCPATHNGSFTRRSAAPPSLPPTTRRRRRRRAVRHAAGPAGGGDRRLRGRERAARVPGAARERGARHL